MKSIFERAEIGKSIIRSTGYSYSLTTADLDELHDLFTHSPDVASGIMSLSARAFEAGFYAGISCAINRGFNKTNDPRTAAAKEAARQ